jgi:acetyl-CoA synthetase
MSTSTPHRATNGAASSQPFANLQPKTRSGKIMRRPLRDIAEGRALGDVTTLRDPAVMAELEQKVAAAQAQDD